MTIALVAVSMLLVALVAFGASPLRRLSLAGMFASSWAIVYGLQALFAPDMISSPAAALVVLSIVIAFATGEFAATYGCVVPHRKPLVLDAITERRLRFWTGAFAWLSLAGAAIYANALGMFDVGSLEELVLLPGIARVQIFSGELDVPLFARVGFLFAYSGAVLAMYYLYAVRWVWWLATPFLSVLILGAAQSGRAGAMAVIMQLLATLYIKAGIQHHRRRGVAAFAVPLGIATVVFFVGGQLLREGFESVEFEDIERVFGSARGYLFGGVSAFAYWFDHLYAGEVTWGRYSFASAYEVLGLAQQEPGIYDYYSPISADETANVYTAFRSFIDDFTILGALGMFFLLGAGMARLAKRVMDGSSAPLAILIPLISLLLFSPLASLTYFNSFLLSCVLPYAIIRFCARGPGLPQAALAS